MKTNKLSLRGHVNENEMIEYTDADYKERLAKFKSKNVLQNIEINFVNINNVEHYQFKYLYGDQLKEGGIGLYGQIRENTGQDIDDIDWFLKKKFLLKTVESEDEIPKKYLRGGGANLFRDKDENIVAYIPSKSKITFKEMTEYIEKIEMWAVHEIEGWKKEIAGEMAKMRSLAMGTDSAQAELFDKETNDCSDFKECHEIKD